MTKQITYSTYSKIVYSTPVHRKITYTTSHIVYRYLSLRKVREYHTKVSRRRGKVRLLFRGIIDGVYHGE